MIDNWALVRNDVIKVKNIHVMPRADVRCHIASPMCFCGARMERIRSGWMWSHNAVDGRA